MEIDVLRVEAALRQNPGDDTADGDALIAVERVVPGIEIADHLDHERPGVRPPVLSFLTCRWKVPVPARPCDAEGIDGEMLANVVPGQRDVVVPHAVYRGQGAEL